MRNNGIRKHLSQKGNTMPLSTTTDAESIDSVNSLEPPVIAPMIRTPVAMIAELLARTYGPYAFGAVILLAIWFSIVRPELANRAIEFDSQQKLVEEFAEVSRTQQVIAVSMSQTAQTMKVTAHTLERTVDRLDHYTATKSKQ